MVTVPLHCPVVVLGNVLGLMYVRVLIWLTVQFSVGTVHLPPLAAVIMQKCELKTLQQ